MTHQTIALSQKLGSMAYLNICDSDKNDFQLESSFPSLNDYYKCWDGRKMGSAMRN